MSNCPHCNYSDQGSWQECPSCGQHAGPAPGAPAPGAPAPYMVPESAPPPDQTPPPGYAPPPHGAPGQAPYAPGPGVNPYAAPTSPAMAPAAYPYAYSQPSMLPTSGKAVASLVIGICSIVIYFMGFILGPLAIGLWASARRDFKQNPPAFKGQGLATAGLITGIIGSLIGLLMVVVIIMVFVMANHDPHLQRY